MNIAIATPEIFLLSTICLILLTDLFLKEDCRMISYLLTQVALLATALLVYSNMGGEKILGLNDMYVRDDLGGVLKITMLLLTSVAFVYARKYLRDTKLWTHEFFLLGMFAVLGMMIMASANNLMIVYLGLELQALSLYAMVAFNRDDNDSSEAAMKYFILGALASGLLLYGISILYGLSGKLDIAGVAAYIASQNVMQNIPLLLALVFIVSGIAFKFGAVPFHMWVPDVYEGAPTSAAALVGTLPKIAAVVFAFRILVMALGNQAGLQAQSGWMQMLAILAVASLLIGNLAAIMQTNIKRMLAYSTISHMGFILLAFMAGALGFSAALYYAVAYIVMGLVGFGVLMLLSDEEHECEEISDLAGLNQRNAWYAFLMLLTMFSMAGIPPLMGFFAKLYVIQALLGGGHLVLAIFAVVMSLIGAFYYLRVVKVMYFDPAQNTAPIGGCPGAKALLSVNALLLLLWGVMPKTVLDWCVQALQNTF